MRGCPLLPLTMTIALMLVDTKLSSFAEHVLGWDREKWVRSPARCCAAARLACKNAVVGIGWGNSHSGYIKGLRKHNSHFVGIHFWQGRLLVFWAGVCQPRMVTVTCSLISRHGWGYKQAYFAWNALGMSIGVRTQAEMKIWCIESMYMLKVVSNEKMQVLKGYITRRMQCILGRVWGSCMVDYRSLALHSPTCIHPT